MQYIDLVSGFFQSGKTTFINRYLEKEISKLYKRVLIISCEKGLEKYKKYDTCQLIVEEIEKKEDFNRENIERIVKEANPEYIIIEYNGVWDISTLQGMDYPKGFSLRNLFVLADFQTFDSYITNMGSIMSDKISNCDILIFTKSGYKDLEKNALEGDFEGELARKTDLIAHINKACSIYLWEDLFKGKKFDFAKLKVSKSDFEIVKLAIFLFSFFFLILGIKFLSPDFFSSKLEGAVGIFFGLLIQILPFILLGSVISALIQIFLPQNKFLKIFEKTSLKSLFLALFMGAFFPVCDCAMVPIATSIVKKGYSIPVTITFLLASPAVNPIVILSTYYAFPNTPKMVAYRLLYGISIAFIMGLILYALEIFNYRKNGKSKREDIVKGHIDKYRFGEINMEVLNTRGRLRYVEAVLMHCKQEFFKLGPYIIFGAMLSSLMQLAIPKSVFVSVNKVNFMAVALMLLCSFFISICSTSNAFIARSFYSLVPQNAILAFLVMGPILDITNVSVMLGTFKKKFVLKLIASLFYIAFIVFSIRGGGIGLV